MRSVDQVSAYEADGVFVLGIADTDWDGFIFQIPISDDLIPDNLTYYVGLSVDQQGLDGGILSVSLGGGFLELGFTEMARAELLMPDSSMRWPVTLEANDRETLRQGLIRIFTYGVEAEKPSLSLELE